jgi:predicted phage baseplate assembly protein
MSCPCDEFSFPLARSVAAGLGGDTLRMARVLGAFPDWRRALLDAIGRHPALDDWRAREEHDLGLMLVEMGAVVFDGIAFYNALINSEAYLRTAQLSGAQRRLVQVLGYRPRPAIGAEVFLAAQADGVSVVNVPAGAAFRTGAFDSLVNGIYQPQAPQVFEIERAAQVDPRINQMTINRVTQSLLPGSISSLLAQPSSVRVQAGQALVLQFGTALVAARVASVQIERLRAKVPATRLHFSGAISVPANTTWSQTSLLAPGATAGLWKLGAQTGESAVIDGSTLLLDTRLSLAVGAVLLFEYQGNLAARRVSACTDELRIILVEQTSTIGTGADAKSLKSPPIKITLTRVTLDSALPWSGIQVNQLSLHHALSRAALPLAPMKDVLDQADAIVVPQLLDAPRTSVATLALQDAHGIGIVSGGALNANSHSATVAATPDWGVSLTAPVQLFGNVLSVSRGESVAAELLGMGASAQAQQTFQLKKKPLTYLNAAGATGRRSTLTVRVAGVLWREVPTFYGVDPAEEVYIVRHDEAGDTFITFGGAARLASGVEIRASYRFGAGAAMPPAGAVAQLAKPIAGLRSVRNVAAATGGADPESAAALAVYAPRTALLLQRAVSLADLEALAAQTADVIAARANWRWDAQGQRPAAVVTYITSAANGMASAVDAALLARLRAAMEDDAPIALQRCLPQTALLYITLLADPRFVASSVAEQVRTALFAVATETSAGGLLQPQQLGPEGVVFLSRLVATIVAVDGVSGIASLFFDYTAFTELAREPAPGHYFDFSLAGAVFISASADLSNPTGA